MTDQHTTHHAPAAQQTTQRPGVPAAPDRRVQLHELIHTRGEPIVTVSLAFYGRRVVGIGRRQEDPTASLEGAAAAATVQAINRLIAPTALLCLEHIQRSQIDQLDLYLVHLTLVIEEHRHSALGVSRILGDSADAAARAVLDATNRYLARLLPFPA
jgi:hypothetical protein